MTPCVKFCPAKMRSLFVVVIDRSEIDGDGMNMKSNDDQDIGHDASGFVNQVQQGARVAECNV